MDCREAREILFPADMPRIDDADVSLALGHAEECDACQEFLEQDRRIAELIRSRVRRERAPRELRERLFTVIARERAGGQAEPDDVRWSRRSVTRWLAAAALAIVALAAGTITFVVTNGGEDGESPARVFAQDYLRRVVEQEEMRGTGEEISNFFARELGIALQPPSVPGYDIERAIICLLGGERGGVIEYVGSGRQLSYYMIPTDDKPLTEPRDVEVGEAGDDMEIATAIDVSTGLTVATWNDGQHQHALVGNVDPAELRQLVDRYACPLTQG